MPNPPRERAAHKSHTLRQGAEAILAKRSREPVDVPVANLQQLVHELQLHQVELEMQNKELYQAHVELAAARERYWGGDVIIESEPGRGTAVIVHMPYRAAADAEVSP